MIRAGSGGKPALNQSSGGGRPAGRPYSTPSLQRSNTPLVHGSISTRDLDFPMPLARRVELAGKFRCIFLSAIFLSAFSPMDRSWAVERAQLLRCAADAHALTARLRCYKAADSRCGSIGVLERWRIGVMAVKSADSQHSNTPLVRGSISTRDLDFPLPMPAQQFDVRLHHQPGQLDELCPRFPA